MKKNMIAATLSAAMVVGSVPFAGAASTVAAVPTRDKGQAVYVDDTRVYPTGYNIADNNYFKLRDIGTLVGFGVEWNGETQTVEINTARTTPSTEGISDTAASGAVAKISGQKITVDGVQVNMTAYQIDGNNYVKLRDIGKQVDFGVGYDNATASVRIDTDAPYTESTTSASGSAITQWNNTMAEFNQAMIKCNWDKSKYLTTAKQYAPVITGKANGTVEDVIAALDTMKGAPVDAVSFDDNPVNMFWANELRKALGQEVTSGGNNTDSNTGNAGNSSSSNTVTDEMLREWELEMVDAINEERRKVGVPELEIDQNLMSWAQYWAVHLTTEFRHSDIDEERAYAAENGMSADDVYSHENITGAGRMTQLGVEMGFNPMKAAMNNFMNSDGHRYAILDEDYTRVGIGFAVSENGTIYCAQEFGL
ncbi:CAP domain-containing protein [Candidatus Agathobaculum pullicola]|uniref:CAP domain-containing protein n=1 Tax=Candidatus Agathobaculum pullicola TaxID=2838426 RepID=UPI003F905FE5